MNFPLEVDVCRAQQIAEDIIELELAGSRGACLPAFAPGSHIAVRLPSNLIRHYSLYSGPHNDGLYRLAVLRQPDSRGGSCFIHDRIRIGDQIEISLPINRFPLHKTSERALFIAGGIGITAIMALATEFARHSSDFSIVYLTKSRERTPFIETLTAEPFRKRLILHHSSNQITHRYDIAGLLKQTAAGTHVYCCGPAALMRAVKLSAAHLHDTHVHFEAFAAEEFTHRMDDIPFDIDLTKSGKRLTVSSGETILQVLLRERVPALYSCQEGTCGTCAVRVIEGIPDHRDTVLTAAERASGEIIITCCSRARTPILTLEL